ncbi:MAG: hypothetical protein Q7K45_00365 [Nanoarchaeota archaeon]|nr:hypothetical protein [Nanoarchaeota archaeon]
MPASVATLEQMPALGIAIGIVNYFSSDQIESLVEKGIAHPSTYRGGEVFQLLEISIKIMNLILINLD